MKTSLILTFVCALIASPAKSWASEEPNPGVEGAVAASRQHLSALAGAIRAYGIINDGKTPASLDVLLAESLVDGPQIFVYPGTGTPVPPIGQADAKGDYTLQPLPGTKDALVREKRVTHTPGKILVAFNDGSVRLVDAPLGSEGPAAAPGSPAMPASTGTKPEPPSVTPPATGLTGTALIDFDHLAPGPLRGDEFKAQGLQLLATQGRLAVTPAQSPPMMMPSGHKQVLTMEGGRITEFALVFNPPVKSVSLTLPGLSGGSSFPTYSLTAFNSSGVGFDVVGQQHWIPKEAIPSRIKLHSGLMSRVVVSVDNRFGNIAWATFNCLPLAGIELER